MRPWGGDADDLAYDNNAVTYELRRLTGKGADGDLDGPVAAFRAYLRGQPLVHAPAAEVEQVRASTVERILAAAEATFPAAGRPRRPKHPRICPATWQLLSRRRLHINWLTRVRLTCNLVRAKADFAMWAAAPAAQNLLQRAARPRTKQLVVAAALRASAGQLKAALQREMCA